MRVREKYLPQGSRKKLSLADYIKNRRETGICLTCGEAMKEHDTCEACRILCGSGHERSASDFRGHQVCGSCADDWKTRERIKGREISFRELCSSFGKVVPKRPVGRPRKQHGEFILSIKEEK